MDAGALNGIDKDIGKLREEVAAATRLLVMEGILDYSGHISVRLPGGDRFLIQSASDPRSDLDPDRLLVVDMDGTVVEGDLKPPLELPLHLEILRSRPDVGSVLHCHMELSIAFTLMKDVSLVPMRARATRWKSGIPTHPDPRLIREPEQGRELAQTLGPHQAALIRAHGMVLVAESVPAVLVDAVHFEENARALMTVLQAGQTPVPLTEEEKAIISGPRDFHVDKLWRYYLGRGRARGVVPAEWCR